MGTSPQDIQATFCATLVDEWARAGVLHAVISPGSRSTPLALALSADRRLTRHVHVDERSAGFLALGLALSSGRPTVVLTTSGTAAVELHPAVVEADLAAVPMLVCTADRPPELLDVAAPQAIDQTHLYGGAVRWFGAPGVADVAQAPRWRSLAARAHAEATGRRPGPVHLNLAFREPLLGTPGELPAPRPGSASWTRAARLQPGELPGDVVEALAGRRGVLVAGAASGDGELVARLAAALGWPLIASPQAPVWSIGSEAVVAAPDAILRAPTWADRLRPEVVVRLGAPLASRVVGEWLAAAGAEEVVVAEPTPWSDPHATASVVVEARPDDVLPPLVDQLEGRPPCDRGWGELWRSASQRAAAAVARALDAKGATSEPGLAQALVDALPAGANLVLSSSMPVRDVEWYVRPRRPLRVWANRGANGIDGVVSTAVGIAAGSGRPTALLIGDIAFLHDTNGLLGAAGREVDLTIVVADNDGGGIFSFLPQADRVDDATFEALFGTPHGLDLVALARGFGVPAQPVEAADADLAAALAAGPGVRVLVQSTGRVDNRAGHGLLNQAVEAALGAPPSS